MSHTKPQRVRVYRYGLLAPTTNHELVRDQLHKAHRYRNRLIEIERDHRDRVRDIQGSHPTVEPLRAQLDDLGDQIADAKAAGDPARRKALQKERKQVREAFKSAKQALRADAQVSVAIHGLNEATKRVYWQARAECGVYWGTYLLVEQSHEASRRGKTDPRFVRWDGTGQLGVQLQGGLPVQKLLTHSQLRIVPVHDRAGRDRFAELHLRVGSEGRGPIWAVWPLRIHRAIPHDAVIKKAQVTLRREGTRERWQVEITVEEGDALVKTGAKAIAIDLGWRSLDELRAARWVDSEGTAGEITVPARVVTGLKKAASLRSIRDRYVDVLRFVLGEQFRLLPPPAPLAEEIQYLSQWKAPRRFVRLCRIWSEHRYDGDDYGFSLIDAWRRRDRHLYDWEAAQRRRSLGRRNQVYADFAAWIGRNYDHVILEQFDLRTWARHWKSEQKSDQYARANRVVTAPSLVRSAIERTWCSTGFVLHDMDAAYTTRDCHVCGSRETWDQAKELFHTCSSCDVRWDQDDNAAKNLLDRWRESGGAERRGRERLRVSAGRWARRKQHRSQTASEDGGITSGPA